MEVPENIKIGRRLDKFEKALKDLKKQIQILQDGDKNYSRKHQHQYILCPREEQTIGRIAKWKCSGCPKTVRST